MSDIILHHYPNSPFSEKMRLIFGVKKIAWNSVIIPAIMPKPDLIALTGGYRRTPVLQIGADIYCDTALICEVIDRLYPEPALYPDAINGMAKTLAAWADSSLFWTVIPYVFQPSGLEDMFGALSSAQRDGFFADRAKFRGSAPRMKPAEATAQLREYLMRVENMLAGGQHFLLASAPCIADFSVYHCLWFIRRAPSVAQILDNHSLLQAWMLRMKAFGHHTSTEMTSEQAINAAREASCLPPQESEFVDLHGIPIGQRVTVTPSDYGMDPVEGELLAASHNEYVIQRDDDRAGRLRVHFPRLGFQLEKV